MPNQFLDVATERPLMANRIGDVAGIRANDVGGLRDVSPRAGYITNQTAGWY